MALLRRTVFRALGCALFVLGAWCAALSAPLTEAQLKAGFLYNFAAFVEWPLRVPNDGALVIGVIGDANFIDVLEEMKGREVNGRKIAIRLVDEHDDINGCAILFIAAPDDRATVSALARVGTSPVLTVGESPRFTKLGGIIRLYRENEKLRFEINIARAEQARLHISSKLLGLAKVTRDGV